MPDLERLCIGFSLWGGGGVWACSNLCTYWKFNTLSLFHISLFEKNNGKNGGGDIANRWETMAVVASAYQCSKQQPVT